MQEEPKEIPQEPTRTKGAINYELIEYPDGRWQIDYESTTENDLASMAIAQDLSTVITNGLMIAKKQANNTKEERHIENLLTKGRAARFGLKMLIDYMQPLYKQYKEEIEKKRISDETPKAN